jgi:hypothetical protein
MVRPDLVAGPDLEQHPHGEGQVVLHGEHQGGVAGGQAVGAVGRRQQGDALAQAGEAGAQVGGHPDEGGGLVAPGHRGGAGDGAVVGGQHGGGRGGDGPGEVVAQAGGPGDVGQAGGAERGGVGGLDQGAGVGGRPGRQVGQRGRTQARHRRLPDHRRHGAGVGVDVPRRGDEHRLARRVGRRLLGQQDELGQVALLGHPGAAGGRRRGGDESGQAAVGDQRVHRAVGARHGGAGGRAAAGDAERPLAGGERARGDDDALHAAGAQRAEGVGAQGATGGPGDVGARVDAEHVAQQRRTGRPGGRRGRRAGGAVPRARAVPGGPDGAPVGGPDGGPGEGAGRARQAPQDGGGQAGRLQGIGVDVAVGQGQDRVVVGHRPQPLQPRGRGLGAGARPRPARDGVGALRHERELLDQCRVDRDGDRCGRRRRDGRGIGGRAGRHDGGHLLEDGQRAVEPAAVGHQGGEAVVDEAAGGVAVRALDERPQPGHRGRRGGRGGCCTTEVRTSATRRAVPSAPVPLTLSRTG